MFLYDNYRSIYIKRPVNWPRLIRHPLAYSVKSFYNDCYETEINMSTQPEKSDITSFATNFSQVLRDTDQFRAPSETELNVFKDHNPFLAISCPSEKIKTADGSSHVIEGDANPILTSSEYGWSFKYCSGPKDDPVSAEVSMPRAFLPEEEDDDDEIRPTWQYQSVITAAELVYFCKEFGWQHIHIEKGSDLCKFALWTACRLLNIPCTGFEATSYDERRFNNAKDNMLTILETYSMTQEATLSPSPGGSISSATDSQPEDDQSPQSNEEDSTK